MFLASKYEEIYPPELKDFVYVTDRAYTKEQLIRMEVDILKVLQFTITVPTPWRLLERFTRLAEATECTGALSKYLLELPLVEYHMLKYRPSLQSAAAIFLAHKILKVEPAWSARLEALTTYSELQLRPCAKDMLILFQAAPRHTLGAVREKYSRRDLFEVSKLRIS
jgi:cyclin B